MQKFLTLTGCLLCFLHLLPAQDSLSRSATEWSFGLHLEHYGTSTGAQGPQMASELGHSGGFYLDAEARVAPRFSWLFGLGYQTFDGWASWGEVPLDNPFRDIPPANFVDSRLADNVTQHWRRLYVGAGAQANLRIGSGDLSFGALLALDRTDLTQTIAYGSSVVGNLCDGTSCEGLAASRMLDGTATIRYRPVYRPGGRLRLLYTHWLSREVALRFGGTLDVVAGRLAGQHREAPENRFAVKGIHYTTDIRRGVEDYALPEEVYFVTPSPTATYWLPGISAGLVFKPDPGSQPLPPDARFGVDLTLQTGVAFNDKDDVGSGFSRRVGLAFSYDTRTKWVGEMQLAVLRQTIGGFQASYAASGVQTGPDGRYPAAINLRTTLTGWSAYGMTLELLPSPLRDRERYFISIAGGPLFITRQRSRGEWFAQDEDGNIYANGRDGYVLPENGEVDPQLGSDQSLLNSTAAVLSVGFGCQLSERLRISVQQVQYLAVGRRRNRLNQIRYLNDLSGVEIQLAARLFSAR